MAHFDLNFTLLSDGLSHCGWKFIQGVTFIWLSANTRRILNSLYRCFQNCMLFYVVQDSNTLLVLLFVNCNLSRRVGGGQKLKTPHNLSVTEIFGWKCIFGLSLHKILEKRVPTFTVLLLFPEMPAFKIRSSQSCHYWWWWCPSLQVVFLAVVFYALLMSLFSFGKYWQFLLLEWSVVSLLNDQIFATQS